MPPLFSRTSGHPWRSPRDAVQQAKDKAAGTRQAEGTGAWQQLQLLQLHRSAAGASLPDHELTALAHADLSGLLGLTAPPAFAHIARHERALPQYTLGHMDRVAALEAGERRYPGLYFHGNAYHNAGVPELVSRSGKLARRLAEELAR